MNKDKSRLKKNHRLVIVEWEDSHGCATDWEKIENCKPTALICQSVGWLIYKNRRSAVVVPHMSQGDHLYAKQQGCGDMTIPVSAIRSIKNLKVAKAKK